MALFTFLLNEFASFPNEINCEVYFYTLKGGLVWLMVEAIHCRLSTNKK